MRDAWSERMRRTWDQLAERNAMHFIATERTHWDVPAFLESGERVVDRLVGLVRSGTPGQPAGIALDLGCGIGRLSFALAKRFDRVIGVDVSEEMVRKGRTLAADLDIRNVDFVRSNGRDLSVVSDGCCDFALSYVVLQHLPTRRLVIDAITEIGRVLKPGGRVVFQVPVYRSGLIVPAWRVMQRVFRLALARAEALQIVRPECGTAFRGTRLRPSDLHDTLRRAGLCLDKVERDPSAYRYCDDWIVVCTKRSTDEDEIAVHGLRGVQGPIPDWKGIGDASPRSTLDGRRQRIEQPERASHVFSEHSDARHEEVPA